MSSTAKVKNVEGVYPLSPAQQGMLFHSLYEPSSGTYVTQVVLDASSAIPTRSSAHGTG